MSEGTVRASDTAQWMRARPAVEGWYWYADVYLAALGFDPARGLVPALGYLRRVTYEDTSWWEFAGRALYSTTPAEGYWRPADVALPPPPAQLLRGET